MPQNTFSNGTRTYPLTDMFLSGQMIFCGYFRILCGLLIGITQSLEGSRDLPNLFLPFLQGNGLSVIGISPLLKLSIEIFDLIFLFQFLSLILPHRIGISAGVCFSHDKIPVNDLKVVFILSYTGPKENVDKGNFCIDFLYIV